MKTKATPHLEFAPPAQPGMGRAWLVAGVAHALLFLALGLATAWKTQTQTVQAEAELWSATPQAAAPRLQEPPPEPEPEPEPAPQPKPAKPAPPPPPAPDLAQERLDAQIALEKKKQQQKKKEAEKAEKLKADKEKAAKEKEKEKEKAERKRKEREKEQEKEDKAKEKAAKEKKAQEEKERDKKKAAEKAKAEKAEADKLEALRADARKDQMKNMQKGLAGASGGENASGTALKSSGPSSSYGGKIVREILDKTTNADSTPGALTVVVFVRASPSGEILTSKVIKRSASPAFDESVLRGIQKMERVPKDVDGKIPEILIREGLELTVSR